MASVYKEESKRARRSPVWTARVRRHGQDLSKSGFRTKKEAEVWADSIERAMGGSQTPLGLGPQRTTLAISLRDYAYDATRYKGGCVQEICKLNKYFRAAGLTELKAVKTRGGIEYDKADGETPVFSSAKVRLPLFELSESRRQAPGKRTLAAELAARDDRGTVAQREREAFASLKVSAISAHHIDHLKQAMNRAGYSPTTIRQELAILSAFFTHAMTIWKWPLVENPVRAIAWPSAAPGRERVLEGNEAERLAVALGNCRNELIEPYVYLVLETAARKHEVLHNVRWGDVDLDKREIRLQHGKTGPRRMPLTAGAVSVLEKLQRGQDHERLFDLSAEAVQAAWRRVCARAEIKGMTLYDLRHSAATDLAMRLQGNIFLLQQFTGHKSLSMLRKYVNLSVAQAAKAADESKQPSLASRMQQSASREPAPPEPPELPELPKPEPARTAKAEVIHLADFLASRSAPTDTPQDPAGRLVKSS